MTTGYISSTGGGNLLWKYKTRAPVYCVAMSTNGEYAAAGSFDARAYYFDRQGNLLWEFRTESSVRDVEISANGSMVVVGSYDQNLYCITKDGGLIWKRGFSNPVNKVALSPDGEFISTGTEGKVFLHDRNGKKLWKNNTGTYTIRGLQVTSIGDSVVAGTRDCDVIYYDRNGRIIWRFRANSQVECVAISSNGRYIVAGTSTGNLFYFDSMVYFQNEVEKADRALRRNLNYGLDIREGRRRLKGASRLMEERQYIKAMDVAREITQACNRSMRDEKEGPDISITGTCKGDFVAGKWKEIRLEIANAGEATAQDVRFRIEGPARLKGASAGVISRLPSGRMKMVKTAIIPLMGGESEIIFRVLCYDFGGREYLKEDRMIIRALDSTEIADREKILFFKIRKSDMKGSARIRRKRITTIPRCPTCRKNIEPDWHHCPYCRTALRRGAKEDRG